MVPAELIGPRPGPRVDDSARRRVEVPEIRVEANAADVSVGFQEDVCGLPARVRGRDRTSAPRPRVFGARRACPVYDYYGPTSTPRRKGLKYSPAFSEIMDPLTELSLYAHGMTQAEISAVVGESIQAVHNTLNRWLGSSIPEKDRKAGVRPLAMIIPPPEPGKVSMLYVRVDGLVTSIVGHH